MSKLKRPVPSLEVLEDRWVPATVRFDVSNLYVSNLNIVAGKSMLTVTQQANGAFQVKDNGATDGSYFVNGNLYITSGNTSDTITLTLNKGAGGAVLGGNLSVRTGNGNDTVSLVTAAAGGTIAGNVNVSFGKGADLFAADPAGGGTAQLSILGSVQISGQPGGATLNPANFPGISAHNYAEFNGQSVPGQSTFVGGNINVQYITETNIGITNLNGTMTVGGNVNILEAAIAPPYVDFGTTGSNTALYNNFVTLSVNTKIGGSATVTGLSGDNYVLADSNVGGSLTANLGSGNNVLDLNFNVPTGTPGAPMTVGGDVNFYAGNGNNTLLFDDNFNSPSNPLEVGRNFNVNFGNGDNTYTFANTGVPGGDVFINGNLSIRAGNGTNPIGTPANPFLASVTGNESFNLGNGTNTVALGLAPGGTVYFNAGNGTNVLSLDNAAVNGPLPLSYFFNAVFGNGSNTFSMDDSGGGGNTVSGYAIGGNGNNTFQQLGDSQIGSPFLLRNF